MVDFGGITHLYIIYIHLLTFWDIQVGSMVVQNLSFLDLMYLMLLGKTRVKHILANSGTFHGDESPGRFCNKHHKKKQHQILAGFANGGESW